MKQHLEKKNPVIQLSVSLYHNDIRVLCGWWQQQDSTCDICMTVYFCQGSNFFWRKFLWNFCCGDFFLQIEEKTAKFWTCKNLVPGRYFCYRFLSWLCFLCSRWLIYVRPLQFNCPICENDYYLLKFVTDSRMNKQRRTSSRLQRICLLLVWGC